MSATISVSLMNSVASVADSDLVVPVGTTLGDFLTLNKIDRSNKVVSIRRANVAAKISNEEATDGLELQDGDFIVVAPSNMKAA